MAREMTLKELNELITTILKEEPTLDPSAREKTLKTNASICYGLGLAFIVVGIVLILIFASQELGKLSPQTPYIVKNNVGQLSDPYKNEFFKLIFENQINWGVLIYLGIKNILLIALVTTAAKYSFNLAKTFTNESFKIVHRRQTISWGAFYLLIVNENEKPLELIKAFNEYNLTINDTTFNDNNQFHPRHLDKAFELICKVKEVVNSDRNNKPTNATSTSQ